MLKKGAPRFGAEENHFHFLCTKNDALAIRKENICEGVHVITHSEMHAILINQNDFSAISQESVGT